MTSALVECVPNLSEGRDLRVLEIFAAAVVGVPGVTLLHKTSDADHHRSVLTFAGPPEAVQEAAVRLAGEAIQHIDLTIHRGVHPRLGALDVLPFVPLRGITLDGCVDLAHRTGERLWNELGLPVYFYEAAARCPERKKLENVRRGQFEGLRDVVLHDIDRQPDLGGPGLHATAGAVIVGARKILIAFNINLQSNNLEVARSIASQIRERNGGLPGVKALGLPLLTRDLVQVSMNITDHEITPIHLVYAEVERLAGGYGVAIAESELIGLMPRSALETAAVGLLKMTNFQSGSIIENRLEAEVPHV